MKKITLIIILLGGVLFGNAQDKKKGIKFETGTFSEILAKSKTEDKFVFVDVYAAWCPPCKKMAKDVFPLESVGNYFNENFVNAKFDAEKGEGIEIAKRYKVTGYPTFLLLDSSGEVVGRFSGGASAESFIAKVKSLKAIALKK